MSDVPHEPSAGDARSREELERTAVPATVRRAPKFSAIIGTGAGIGFVAGFLCGLLLPSSTSSGRGTVGLLIGLGFALLGGLVAGLIALWLDRDTPARLKEMKAREATDPSAWSPASPGDGDAQAPRASAGPRDPEERE